MANSQQCSEWQRESALQTRRLAMWTAAWLISLATLSFGPPTLWDFAILPSAIAAAINFLIGIGMVLANRRVLHSMDELEQKIFLDASAVTLGVGLVFAGAYEILGAIRLLPFEPAISHLMVVMALTFLAAIITGKKRFG